MSLLVLFKSSAPASSFPKLLTCVNGRIKLKGASDNYLVFTTGRYRTSDSSAGAISVRADGRLSKAA